MNFWMTRINVTKEQEGKNSGFIANQDAADAAQKIGFNPLNYDRYQREITKEAVAEKVNTMLSCVHSGDIVVVQFPTWQHDLNFERELISNLEERKVQKVLLLWDALSWLHDDSIRDYTGDYGFQMMNRFDLVISPNKKMSARLRNEGGVQVPIIDIGLWDYRVDSPMEKRVFQKRLYFAGTLDKTDFSSYRAETPFYLIGNPNGVSPEERQQENLHFLGEVDRQLLPSLLDGGFGVISYKTPKKGTPRFKGAEKYGHYNNPLKLSLYLSAGIPVIVDSKSAHADLVREQGLGLILDDLNQIDNALEQISGQEYEEYLCNVQRYSIAMRTGHFTKKVLMDAINFLTLGDTSNIHFSEYSKKKKVYHINKAIGKASSGVEYAQDYRYKAMSQLNVEQKLIFTDYIRTNLIEFTADFQWKNEDVIWIYSYLAGRKNRPTTFTIESFEVLITSNFLKNEDSEWIEYTYEQQPIKYKLWKLPTGYVDRVDVIINNKLTQVWCYTDSLSHVEYFSQGTLRSRAFFNEEGEIAYRQYYEKGEITLTFIGKKVLQGRNAFFQEFFRKLKWNASDLLLVDRSLDVLDAVLMQANDASVGVVIHAEHYNQGRSKEDWIAWNNFYEYPFTNSERIDWFIVATQAQAALLKDHFTKMKKDPTKIRAIPVGHVPKYLAKESKSHNYSLMTASRLAEEKHIDTLIKAVVKVKRILPQLSFSIYGEGGKRKALGQLIEELHAQDYIFLEGHQKLAEIYPEHSGYLTASHSEGFGLTVLEAVSHGLPIIGLKVPYGNLEFVEEGVNGFLTEKGTEEENILGIAESIEKLFSEDFSVSQSEICASKKIEEYTEKAVQNKWDSLLKEGSHATISG